MLKSVFFAFISLIENSPLEIQRRYIKQISPWRTNHNNIFVNCTGIALTLENLTQLLHVSIHLHPSHPLQQTTANRFNV